MLKKKTSKEFSEEVQSLSKSSHLKIAPTIAQTFLGEGAVPIRTHKIVQYVPPECVLPKNNAQKDLILKEAGIAFDAVKSVISHAYDSCGYQNNGGYDFYDGFTGFPGYYYLGQLLQKAEYRNINNIFAEEMTREFIKLTYKGSDKDTEDGKLAQLYEEIDRFDLKEIISRAILHDGAYGIGRIFIDVEDGGVRKANGTDITKVLTIDSRKIPKNSLVGFTNIEPIWTYSGSFNANDPFRKSFYQQEFWWVMGMPVHRTRLLSIVSNEVPDLLKSVYNFGGVARSQLCEPYIQRFERTVDATSDMVKSFNSWILSTDMSEVLSGGSSDDLLRRLQIAADNRNNNNFVAIDRIKEEISNVSAPISGLHQLLAQHFELIPATIRIPLVKYAGITPSGLNATSDGEIRTFYDTIHAMQERILRNPLKTMIEVLQLNLWGELDKEISFEFVPLYRLTEKEEAEVGKFMAQTIKEAIEAGALSGDEGRDALVNNQLMNIFSSLPEKEEYEFDEPEEDITEPEYYNEPESVKRGEYLE